MSANSPWEVYVRAGTSIAGERVRAEIDELFASEQELGQVLEQVVRLRVRLVMQAALEAEVTEFLGRDRYVRGERDRAGYGNGHGELQVKTTAGPVVLQRPKVGGTDQPFASRLLGKGVSRTNALEVLVLSGFVRGLSVRDVEAALAEALGPEAALSKSTVSRICEQVKTEFDAWKHRDLTGSSWSSCTWTAATSGCTPGRGRAGLVRLGDHHPGRAVAGRAGTGQRRGPRPWAGFLGELVARGLRPPLLVITDGAPGLIGAVEIGFPNSLRQRCLIHRCRRLLAKVPTHAQAEVKQAFWQIFDDIDGEPGDQAVAQARQRAYAFADRDDRRYPAAVACLTDTLAELTCFLGFPREHWARIRHTNLIERTLGETRRRTKVIGRLPGERSCLSLVWAVLDRASRGWRGVVMTPAGVRLLQDRGRQLHHPSRLEEVVGQTVTAAA